MEEVVEEEPSDVENVDCNDKINYIMKKILPTDFELTPESVIDAKKFMLEFVNLIISEAHFIRKNEYGNNVLIKR